MLSAVRWSMRMCKAVAEDSAEDGSWAEAESGPCACGMPYAIMAFFAWFVFKRRSNPPPRASEARLGVRECAPFSPCLLVLAAWGLSTDT